MPTFAVVDIEGLIINRVVLADEAVDWSPPESCTLVQEIEFPLEIGGNVVNGVYSPPQPPAPIEQPIIIPRSASRLGLKRAFGELGMWEAVKAAIAADPDVEEEWGLAQEIRRDDRIVQGLIQQLGLTDSEVDGLLVRAGELVA